MTLNRILVCLTVLLLAGSVSGIAQNTDIILTPSDSQQSSPAADQAQPGSAVPPQAEPPPAASQDQASSATPSESAPPKSPDKAAAYYHFTMAHMYEELVSMYGRADYANKAIEEYRLAIDNDSASDYLNAGLAELYAKTGRIRDAVLEAQDILKLDPKSVEDHLLLGRLYRLNNELLKSEGEFKTAVNIQPDSEEAVTTLAYLYNEEGDSARALQVLSAIPESARTAKLFSALGFTYEQEKDYKIG